MLQKLASQVLELYTTAAQAVTAYGAAAGLACQGGCVRCCISEKVEATVLEMVPAAFHLFSTNQAELLIKRLEKEERSRQCLLFRPDLSTPLGGGCSQYPFRPLVCRLFGFAGNADRQGTVQLARCRWMAPGVQTTIIEGGDLTPMPLFHNYGMALTAIHPDLGTRRKPINEALYAALTKVGLILDLEQVPQATVDIDQPPDAPATTPARPRRKAA